MCIVGGIAVGGFLLAALTGHSNTSVQLLLGKPPGVNLDAVAASPAIAKIAAGGNPPADIVDSLVVPQGWSFVSTENNDASLGPFDRSVTLGVPASHALVLALYQSDLPRGGWKIAGASTSDGGASTLYGTKAGADGYYWEIGVTVASITKAAQPSLSRPAVAPASSLKLRLFEVDDQN